jgi:hypothetical protein
LTKNFLVLLAPTLQNEMTPKTRTKSTKTKEAPASKDKPKSVRISKKAPKAVSAPSGSKSLTVEQSSLEAIKTSSPAHRHAEPSKPALKNTPTVENLEELNEFLSDSEDSDESSVSAENADFQGIPSDVEGQDEAGEMEKLSEQTKSRLPKVDRKDKVYKLALASLKSDHLHRALLESFSSVDYPEALKNLNSNLTLSNSATSTGSGCPGIERYRSSLSSDT